MKRGNKKLGISAETVRVISGKELTEVQGGWPSEVPTNTCTSYPGGSGAGSIYECMSALCRTM